jgi:hypothetical protein
MQKKMMQKAKKSITDAISGKKNAFIDSKQTKNKQSRNKKKTHYFRVM